MNGNLMSVGCMAAILVALLGHAAVQGAPGGPAAPTSRPRPLRMSLTATARRIQGALATDVTRSRQASV